jgi:hypothetical protein
MFTTRTSPPSLYSSSQRRSGLHARGALQLAACIMCLLRPMTQSISIFDSFSPRSRVLHPLRLFGQSMISSSPLSLGLLSDDNEWHQCLEEAGLMATGHPLRVLFVTILIDCSPTYPRQLWDTHKHRLCDDLRYTLQHRHIQEDPSDEDISDYGLFLLNSTSLSKTGWICHRFSKCGLQPF